MYIHLTGLKFWQTEFHRTPDDLGLRHPDAGESSGNLPALFNIPLDQRGDITRKTAVPLFGFLLSLFKKIFRARNSSTANVI